MTEQPQTKPTVNKGGRPTGSRDKRPRKRRGYIELTAAATGEMPLEYALRIMRDRKQKPARRDAMCKIAMPYCHPAFASVKVTHDALPLTQLMAGMSPDEIAAFELAVGQLARAFTAAQSARLIDGSTTGTSAQGG